MFVSGPTLRDLISDEVRDVFSGALTPLWTHAWNLGYASAKALVTGQPADFTAKHEGEHLAGFIGTEGEHWLSQIARTGLGNNSVRSEVIARTEVAQGHQLGGDPVLPGPRRHAQAPAAVAGRVRHLQGRRGGRRRSRWTRRSPLAG